MYTFIKNTSKTRTAKPWINQEIVENLTAKKKL